jgi:carbon storage regulator CsrA
MHIFICGIREPLRIGDSITVTVFGVKGDKVCIGANAPPDVLVEGKQIGRRKHRERESLSSNTTRRRT